MRKKSYFSRWKSLITAINLIIFYVDDSYLSRLKSFVGYCVTKKLTPPNYY